MNSRIFMNATRSKLKIILGELEWACLGCLVTRPPILRRGVQINTWSTTDQAGATDRVAARERNVKKSVVVD